MENNAIVYLRVIETIAREQRKETLTNKSINGTKKTKIFAQSLNCKGTNATRTHTNTRSLKMKSY